MVNFQEAWLKKQDSNGTLVSEWAEKSTLGPTFVRCTWCKADLKTSKGFEKLVQHSKTSKHQVHLKKPRNTLTQLTLLNRPVSCSTLKTASTSNTNEDATTAVEVREEDQSNNIGHSNSSDTTTTPISKNVSIPPEDQLKKYISLFNPREDSLKAELLWCLYLIQTKGSLNSCKGVTNLFKVMFPGTISDKFSLSPTKAAYLITDALRPHFKSELLADINKSESLTVQFDETCNNENVKELQVRIIYWSELEKLIVNRHLETKFIDRATGEKLFRNLMSCINSNEIDLKKILTLGRDGPNVNKTVARLFKEKFKELNYKKPLEFGSCYLHIVNNGFLKGLNQLSIVDAASLVENVKKFFDRSDLRWNNYKKIQTKLKLPSHSFIKHCSTRWLTLGPAVNRLIEQLPALKEYFLKSTHDKSTLQNKTYLEIVECIKNPCLESVLHFLSYITDVFTGIFTAFMQRREPLVYLIYDRLEKLLMLMMSNIIKPEIKVENKLIFQLSPSVFAYSDLHKDGKIRNILEDSSKFLPLNSIKCSQNTQYSLQDLKKEDKTRLLMEFQKFYKFAILHIDGKIENRNFLKSLQCLHPLKIKGSESTTGIVEISQALPLYDVDVNILTCEWQLLQLDDDVRFKFEKNERIDEYWSHIFDLRNSSTPRYPQIMKVVKAALSLPHGSADVERGFSTSAQLLTENKARMTERTLDAQQTISDALKKYEGDVFKVPITKELLKLGQSAHSNYMAYLDEQKRIEEARLKEEAMNAAVKEKEEEALKSLQLQIKNLDTLKEELRAAQDSVREAAKNTEAMEKIVEENAKKNTLNSQIIAQSMSSLISVRKKEKKLRKAVDDLQDQINKKNDEALKSVAKKNQRN